MEINYVGEHLIWGHLGHLAVILSFTGAIFSAISYWFAQQIPAESASWKKLARTGYAIHTAGVLGIISILFILLFNHYFEYQYVWQHSNRDLPLRYILSCFWEGQEGSFLLWTFWNMILGFILMRSAGDWEYSTMAIVCLVQVFLSSMLLGIYIGDLHIGSDPFILLRDHPDFRDLPFVQKADYLKSIDGRGLNPLLQNYWMTIHPPILFLGFSATLFPFAFAMAGIWRKLYHEWINPALGWTFFGICILGTGILMGGAWAYEALSFGGFWAWDPVENASLVPWITLVAGGHVMLINRARKQSAVAALFLIYISFILILYSTFLTRSGILGETSVHAFTDLGMTGQLLIYLLFFLWMPSLMVIDSRKKRVLWLLAGLLIIPAGIYGGTFKIVSALFLLASIIATFKIISQKNPYKEKDENVSSREFWMFIGALILLISAFQIIFSTSTPAINKFLTGDLSKIFGKLYNLFNWDILKKLADAKMGLQEDPIKHYNSWQIPFAIITALLLGIGQFLKYKQTPPRELIKNIRLSLLYSFILTLASYYFLDLDQPMLLCLLFASLFAVAANTEYLFRILKGKIGKGGSSIAHVGFGLILTGALISAGKKEIISKNVSVYDLGKELPAAENVLLFKNDTVRMGEYLVSYRGDSISGINIFYHVDYLKPRIQGKPEKLFSLSPIIQTNPRMGNVSEPSTKHYIHKDVFTHVTSVSKRDEQGDEWDQPKVHQFKIGDTLSLGNFRYILKGVSQNPSETGYFAEKGDIALGARIEISSQQEKYYAMPLFIISKGSVYLKDTVLEKPGLKISLSKINPSEEKFQIEVTERKNKMQDFIVMKAIIFPGINILWTGCILMALGTGLAVYQRIKRNAIKHEHH